MRIASVPRPSPWNPYSRLLYDELMRLGFEVTEERRFSARWLWSARREVRFLHFQWPEGLYQRRRGARILRLPFSWLKLPVFVVRLVAARSLGYRLVWTMHQVYPHETVSRRLDRVATRALGRLAHLVVVHDEETAARARATLGLSSLEIEIVPHGSYIGVYPQGRRKEIVRAELEIANDAFVFLCFGQLREYKDVDVLLDAFGSASLPTAALVIAGPTRRAKELEPLLDERAAADPRVKLLLRFIPVEQVAELFESCDVAVLPRGDGGTSGSLVLALSLATPVIAADTPNYRALTAGEAGWYFTPGDQASLRTALERAAADPEDARRRRGAALASATGLSWPAIGERFAQLLRGIAE